MKSHTLSDSSNTSLSSNPSLVTQHPLNRTRPLPSYQPHLGYIGSQKVDTSNYIFKHTQTNERNSLEAYPHAQTFGEDFLKRSPEEHFFISKKLTEFIRKRGLTFSKKLSNGESRTFAVPVTNTIVPLPKSTFSEIEKSAQALVLSLRWIMQSIYGSEKIEDSEFIQSLPTSLRELFIKTIKETPQYFKELHHPVMKDYPFFEVVGLDLVLVEDYIQKNSALYRDHSRSLPFKLLELNAGSPSGASNNSSILEGLLQFDPCFANLKEKVMPNNHFEILRATFDSIGRMWTGEKDGLSIILPPGGSNGATPEIHQLAAFSGMPYVDANQLYIDQESRLRLRTVSSVDHPVVTSIYSRVNADSVLFSKEKEIFLKDAESGKALFEEDAIANEILPQNKPHYLKDKKGNLIPVESVYAIPNAIELIHSKKLYIGGLNRILDNKLILSVLTEFGPKFYAQKLAQEGLEVQSIAPLSPPESLPPARESLETIYKTPEDWVIKAPDLSGGSGVNILLTMPKSKKNHILKMISINPEAWAYQKLVKIARIPIATQEGSHIRFANYAADVRMWCFFGAGNEFKKPKLTHNGLVRTAPVEKGSMSSIVNTSKGGGYAPLLIIDDTQSKESVDVYELTKIKTPTPHRHALPIFVAPQLVQISKMLQEIYKLLCSETEELTTAQVYKLLIHLKTQTNEVLSYLDPRNLEPINEALELLSSKVSSNKLEQYKLEQSRLKLKFTELLNTYSHEITAHQEAKIKNLPALEEEYLIQSRQKSKSSSEDDSRMLVSSFIHSIRSTSTRQKFARVLSALVKLQYSTPKVSTALRQSIKRKLEVFCELAFDRLSKGSQRDCVSLFSLQNLERPKNISQTLSPLFPSISSDQTPYVATQWELQNQQSILYSEFVKPEVREAHLSWLRLMKQVDRVHKGLNSRQKLELIERKREEQFKKFPFLKEAQTLIDQKSSHSPEQILKLLPLLPYAHYNFIQFCKHLGIEAHQAFNPSSRVLANRIHLLNHEQIESYGFNPHYQGECFAQKPSKHALLSDSQTLIWLHAQASPFVQAYTLGHELIHFHQIQSLFTDEKSAYQKGSLEFAEFLNLYGNFMSQSIQQGSLENQNLVYQKSVLYGLAEWIPHQKKSELAQQCFDSYQDSNSETIESLSNLVSVFFDSDPSIKVKALREVIPCLENAKNIRFAKDLGLKISIDEVKSALPAANSSDLRRHRAALSDASMHGGASLKVLDIIAQYQFKGVKSELVIKSKLKPIQLGHSYNSQQ